MTTQFMQEDARACLDLKSEGGDKDALFNLIVDQEIDSLDDPDAIATDVAERVLNVMGLFTHKPVADTRKIAETIAFRVLQGENEDLTSEFADALLETANQAWECGLKEMKLHERTTLEQIVTNRPKFAFKI